MEGDEIRETHREANNTPSQTRFLCPLGCGGGVGRRGVDLTREEGHGGAGVAERGGGVGGGVGRDWGNRDL